MLVRVITVKGQIRQHCIHSIDTTFCVGGIHKMFSYHNIYWCVLVNAKYIYLYQYLVATGQCLYEKCRSKLITIKVEFNYNFRLSMDKLKKIRTNLDLIVVHFKLNYKSKIILFYWWLVLLLLSIYMDGNTWLTVSSEWPCSLFFSCIGHYARMIGYFLEYSMRRHRTGNPV